MQFLHLNIVYYYSMSKNLYSKQETKHPSPKNKSKLQLQIFGYLCVCMHACGCLHGCVSVCVYLRKCGCLYV